MFPMILLPGVTPVDSTTHIWWVTVGNVAYFVPRQ